MMTNQYNDNDNYNNDNHTTANDDDNKNKLHTKTTVKGQTFYSRDFGGSNPSSVKTSWSSFNGTTIPRDTGIIRCL